MKITKTELRELIKQVLEEGSRKPHGPIVPNQAEISRADSTEEIGQYTVVKRPQPDGSILVALVTVPDGEVVYNFFEYVDASEDVGVAIKSLLRGLDKFTGVVSPMAYKSRDRNARKQALSRRLGENSLLEQESPYGDTPSTPDEWIDSFFEAVGSIYIFRADGKFNVKASFMNKFAGRASGHRYDTAMVEAIVASWELLNKHMQTHAARGTEADGNAAEILDRWKKAFQGNVPMAELRSIVKEALAEAYPPDVRPDPPDAQLDPPEYWDGARRPGSLRRDPDDPDDGDDDAAHHRWTGFNSTVIAVTPAMVQQRALNKIAPKVSLTTDEAATIMSALEIAIQDAKYANTDHRVLVPNHKGLVEIKDEFQSKYDSNVGEADRSILAYLGRALESFSAAIYYTGWLVHEDERKIAKQKKNALAQATNLIAARVKKR